MDSASAPPAVDLAAEEATIRRIDSLWSDAVARRDTAVITATYAQDAVFLPPNAPRVEGTDNIRGAWIGLMSTVGFGLSFAPDRIGISPDGEMAYDIGTYHFRFENPRGTRQEDVGKYLVVWRKVAGQWKAVADMFSSDSAR